MFRFSLKKIKIIFLSFIFFLFLSFFFSINKIYIPILVSIIFLFSQKKIKKILFINLILISFILKIFILNFGSSNALSKLIYEKHFLYGVQNLDSFFSKQPGDLNGFIGSIDNSLKKKIKIKTDKYGFRNENFNNEFDYFLVGDSFLHQHRLDQKDLINYQLQKYNLKTYNAGIAIYDISHYFELIKFFKEKKEINQKFIMFIYPGNDFLNYGNPKNNYFDFFENDILISYVKLRKLFNFHSQIKFFTNKYKSLKKDNKNKVSSYLIKEKKMFFFNDFSKSYSKEISFNEEFTKTYQKFLPDMIIVIPTKFDVYCNFINNVPCNESNYVEKLASIELIKDINIIDSSSFLIKKALFELENNKFLYDFKDTHLNSLGNMYLADFFAEVVNKN
jgi:hypothetical protein